MFARKVTMWIAAAFLLLAGAVPASAATYPLATCIARATHGMAPRAVFANRTLFDCTTPQVRLGSGDFWVRSAPIPAGAAALPGLSVRFTSTWQQRLSLDILYADGALRRVAFPSRASAAYLRLGSVYAVPLPARAAPPVRLLWHVWSAPNLRGVVLGAALADATSSARSEVLAAALYGIFVGTGLALIVYNLALWGALRQSFQLVYCAMLLFLLGYALSSSGALGTWLPQLDNNDRFRINQVMLSGAAISVLLFARAFFETRTFTPLLVRGSHIVMAAIALGTVAIVLAPLASLRTIEFGMTLAYAGLIALVPPVLWHAWQQRSRYTGLFALAWGAPIGFAGLRVANGLHLIGWQDWFDHSTLLSMMLEALLSSVAIAYRIKLLSRERDEAREQELAARMLADVDPLTGLLNRRAFLARATARRGEQSLLLADIDHFKTINSTIGHDGGDEVLRNVARALRAAVPDDALVARLGGEEFAIVVDAAADVVPADVLARLRSERMPFDLRVTASIGSCNGPMTTEAEWSALYHDADQALFQAKAAGRDRARRAHRLAA